MVRCRQSAPTLSALTKPFSGNSDVLELCASDHAGERGVSVLRVGLLPDERARQPHRAGQQVPAWKGARPYLPVYTFVYTWL